MSFPTTGYKEIELSFWCRRTGTGFDNNTVEYSLNGGTSYTNFAVFNPVNSTGGSVQTFDFSAISGADNNPDFEIRITLNGATGAAGNNRYDNIVLEGVDFFFPITLSHFTARPTGSSVQLDWRTATELNNDYMEVEHSTDGRNYRKIGTVQGAGTTQEEQVYNFLHEAPAAGLNYYRLLQVDYDGAYEYHGPVSVRMSGGDKLGGALSLFPTVVSEAVQVEYEGQLSNEAELQVIGMDGRVWRTQRWEVKSASLSVPVQDLPAGMYLLRLQVGRDVEVARFVKQ